MSGAPKTPTQSEFGMPMIGVYATKGTFKDNHMLAQNLAKAVMR
jgi:hypothetical protein